MANIVEVIKDIERCISHEHDSCSDCRHSSESDECMCIDRLLNEALELLKEYAVIKETISDGIHETAKMFRRTEEDGWIEKCDRRARQSLSD